MIGLQHYQDLCIDLAPRNFLLENPEVPSPGTQYLKPTDVKIVRNLMRNVMSMILSFINLWKKQPKPTKLMIPQDVAERVGVILYNYPVERRLAGQGWVRHLATVVTVPVKRGDETFYSVIHKTVTPKYEAVTLLSTHTGISLDGNIRFARPVPDDGELE